ncbi:cilia- and flagella-associated protein 57-like [Hypomesus transpacificus]|uniref:cilia- and flagella-associated protein 57-like n=1 Tax=Hypomesus transpacificus TaxID=137520 RepID=UPI001F073053|nr:cilia- and flagella-associated protein 57-like [Hypomesus transpacificus]
MILCLLGLERSQGMHALTISANRRYLAVSECADRATITVYDLQHEQNRKRKVLTGGDTPVREFVSIAFSSDSKYLIGQSGSPDWTLFYWMWEKQKVLAVVKTTSAGNPINQVTFNPFDNTQICVTGSGVFRLFRYAEGALKPSTSQKLESCNFLSHAWMSDERVIAGTDTGRLMVFESGDLRGEMSVISKTSTFREHKSAAGACDDKAPPQLPRVTAITAYSKGFACSAGPGAVWMFEKTDDKDNYKKTRQIRIPPDACSQEPSQAQQQQIVSLVISPSEEVVVTSTDQGQLYSITLSSTETNKVEHTHFEYLSNSFHTGSITGLSICIRKPIIATCSLDQSVRIWNFETNTLELYKEFQEEAYSIALHPSGLFLLVGFSDKLRLMNLLIDDIRTFKEFNVRGCRECVFSHGGHLFAAANCNIIHIYSTTTTENILNLKGHSGKVRCVAWSVDDSRLVSCGMEGAVYEWNTLTGVREAECVLKSCSYTSVTLSPDAKSVFAVGGDCTLKEIQDCQILREVSTDEVVYTTIALSRSGRTLFVGTSLGTVRAIKYPLSAHKDWIEYQAHAAPVAKMAITFDDQYLLTVSEDRCLVIWKIIDKEGRGLKRDKEVSYAEEILITKCDLEEKNQNMLELKTRVEELKMENEYQLRLKDMNNNEKLKELNDSFIHQTESMKTQIQVLRTENNNMEVAHQQYTSEMLDKHSKELQDLEAANSQKLMQEYQKYQELQVEAQSMQVDFQEQLQNTEKCKLQALEDLTFHYEGKMQEKALLLEQSQEECRTQVCEFEESRKQIEEDGDREIQDMRVRYERWLKDERDGNLRMKGENGILKKKFSSLQKDIDERNVNIEKMRLELEKLQGIIKVLEKDVLALKKEIRERDETIQDKEKSIYELKKKNQELEKFKFVLDYKIKELKGQIEPRENDIREMKDQILEMEEELSSFHKKNNKQELDITELKLKLTATDKEVHKEMQKVRDREAFVRRFKTDLHKCVGHIQDPKALKKSIRGLYEFYVHQFDQVDMVGVDGEVEREHARHREHLERNVAALKRKMADDARVHGADNVKIMQENVMLISDINSLRMELCRLRSQVHNYESLLGHNRKSKDQATSSLKALLSPRVNPITMVTRLQPEEEGERIVQFQRLEIVRLRREIQVLMRTQPFRPPSDAKLPSLDTSI